MSTSPAPPPLAPLAPSARLAGAGLVSFLVASTIALRQLAHANKPHELTHAPLVALIQLVAVGLLGLALMRLWRAFKHQAERPLSAWHWLLGALLLPLTGTAVLFLLSAASTAIQVLAS
jgi:hypothetical protein